MSDAHFEPVLARPVAIAALRRSVGVDDATARMVWLPVTSTGVPLASIANVTLQPFAPLAQHAATSSPSPTGTILTPTAGDAALYVPLLVCEGVDRVAVIDACRGELSYFGPRGEVRSGVWLASMLLTLLLLVGLNGAVSAVLYASGLASIVVAAAGYELPPGVFVLATVAMCVVPLSRRTREFLDNGDASLADIAGTISPWHQPRDPATARFLRGLALLQLTHLVAVPFVLWGWGQANPPTLWPVSFLGLLIHLAACATLCVHEQRRPSARVRVPLATVSKEAREWVASAAGYAVVGFAVAGAFAAAYEQRLPEFVEHSFGVVIPSAGAVVPVLLQLLAVGAVYRATVGAETAMRIATALAVVLGVVVKAAWGDLGGGIFTAVMLGAVGLTGGGSWRAAVRSTLSLGVWMAVGRIAGAISGGLLLGVVGATIGEELGEQLAVVGHIRANGGHA